MMEEEIRKINNIIGSKVAFLRRHLFILIFINII